MTQLKSALRFTGQEIQSAIGLYFEPLLWIRRVVHKVRKSPKRSDSIDFRFNELADLSATSKRPRQKSVGEDWSAWLPEDKAQFFDVHVRQLEAAYALLSISLNEALELQRIGQATRARQAIAFIPSLSMSLADPLYTILRALLNHAKKRGTIPNVAPLYEANFRGKRSQRFARLNSLLTAVLLTKRALFFHKISALEEMIGDLVMGVRVAADDLASHSSASPDADWIAVDNAHFDLNTCLRETIVILKSFLVAIPEEQLEMLEAEITRAWRREPENEPTELYEHRRWTPLTSEEIAHAKKSS
jgi:hypothetical protein